MEKIDVLIGWLAEMKEFTQGQAPDVVRQFIEYELFVNKLVMLIACLVFVGAVAIIYFFRDEEDYGAGKSSVFVGSMLIAIALLLGAIAGINIAKIKIAPKVYVLNYITNSI